MFVTFYLSYIFLGEISEPLVAGKQSCYSCKGVSRKEDCNMMKECTANEVCYSRRTVNIAGNVTFDYGCVAAPCSGITSSEVIGRRRRAGEAAHCYQCCDSDAQGCTDHDTLQCGCNRNLCSLPSDGTKICFSCDYVPHPSDCTTTKLCYQDQMCSTSEVSSASNGQTVYTMGCTSSRVCAVFEQNHYLGSYCTSCCDRNFCNIALCRTTTRG